MIDGTPRSAQQIFYVFGWQTLKSINALHQDDGIFGSGEEMGKRLRQ